PGGQVGNNPTVDTTNQATNGRNLSQVLDRINMIPDGMLHGAPALVSSGASNEGVMPGGVLTGAQLSKIDQQIQSLKRAGAGDIMLLGVGGNAGYEGTGANRKYFDLRNINPQLAQIAARNGVRFSGALPSVIHPNTNYYGSAARYTPQGRAI